MIGVQNVSVIVHFCDWLKERLSEKDSPSDFIDYAYDEELYGELQRYAKKYLDFYYPVYDEPDYVESAREFLYGYIDSPIFSRHMQEFLRYGGNELLTQADMDTEEKLWEFWHEFLHELRYYWRKDYYRPWSKWKDGFEPVAERFLSELQENVNGTYVRPCVIHPERLARTYRHVFRKMQDGETGFASPRGDAGRPAHNLPPMLRLMTRCQIELETESNFIKSLQEPVDFNAMPKQQFERIVDEYLQNSGDRISNPAYVRQRLIKCFTQSKANLIIDRLTLAEARYKFQESRDEYAPETWDAKRTARNLDKLIQRYRSRDIPYRCFISHSDVNHLEKSDSLESNQDYEDFIKTYWNELNRSTGDFLDIYYDTEYGVSGRDIVKTCSKIPPELRGQPLLVLWEHDVSQARGINIDRLTKAEICKLIITVAECIREGYSFPEIIEEANGMAAEKRNEKKPVQTIDNSVHVGGDMNGGHIGARNVRVSGDMKGGHIGDNVGMSMGADDLEKLLSGFAEAKEKVNNMTELDAKEREFIVTTLQSIEDAVKNGDDKAQKEEKGFLKKSLSRMAETGEKVINVLAGIATIAQFLGFVL